MIAVLGTAVINTTATAHAGIAAAAAAVTAAARLAVPKTATTNVAHCRNPAQVTQQTTIFKPRPRKTCYRRWQRIVSNSTSVRISTTAAVVAHNTTPLNAGLLGGKRDAVAHQ